MEEWERDNGKGKQWMCNRRGKATGKAIQKQGESKLFGKTKEDIIHRAKKIDEIMNAN